MIAEIGFVVLHVADQTRSLRFYLDRLGFVVLRDEPHGEEGRWIEVGPPDASTRLALVEPEEEDRARIGMATVGLVCSDVERWYEELKEKGVGFVEPPTPRPEGGLRATCVDPDGHRLVLVA